MSVTKTPKKQLEYAKKYLENFDEIKVRVPTGEKSKIKAHGDKHDGSMNAFINRAISETMERDKGG